MDWNEGFWKLFGLTVFFFFDPCCLRLQKQCSGDIFVCLESLILSFTCNLFAYLKFHTDWGRVISKIKQNELDCCDTAPLKVTRLLWPTCNDNLHVLSCCVNPRGSYHLRRKTEKSSWKMVHVIPFAKYQKIWPVIYDNAILIFCSFESVQLVWIGYTLWWIVLPLHQIL